MNDKTTILIKTDKKVKVAAQKAAKAIGIPLGTLMGMYLRKFAHDPRLEFEAPLIPSKKLRRVIAEYERDVRSGNRKGFSPVFESAQEMDSWLDENL